MKSTEIKFTAIPSTEEVKAERDRLAYRSRYGRVLRSTIYALVVVAAVAVLLATLFLPVLQVSGDSMNPTLEDRDILLLVKSDSMKTGDLCGFYWQNKLLLKRVIGQPGDVISMDEDGHVTVNGTVLDEPYVDELALGECDIRFPYQVPENRYFVLGDHRSVSIDSRSSVIGCVEKKPGRGAGIPAHLAAEPPCGILICACGAGECVPPPKQCCVHKFPQSGKERIIPS